MQNIYSIVHLYNSQLKLYNPIDKLLECGIISTVIKGDAIWERLKERNESKVNKSVYSLVLADDVVEAIDRLAYSMNTSRSNLINQILAERVQLLTPEKECVRYSLK